MRFKGKLKKIRVKVEDIETGEVVKDYDCGVDEVKAEELERTLLLQVGSDKCFVYQSVEL